LTPPSKSDPSAQKRVRLMSVVRTRDDMGRVRVRVELEWCGETYQGEAIDESGYVIELRTAAVAALEAVSKTAQELKARVVGAKEVRAFDHSLIVVAVATDDPGDGGSLVGAVLRGADPTRAAAMALLQSLNRVLGNYLRVSPEAD
jgi:hypothetical protein